MKKKIQIIFNLFSFIFLMSLIVLYSYRFFHYRSLANTKKELKTIYETVTSVTSNYYEMLNKEEDTYYFKEKDISNYLYYSGNLWRIISLKEDKITLISDMPITSKTLNNKYEGSTIDSWLNNEYYEILNKEYLLKTSTCVNTLENNKDNCNTLYEGNVVLPSISLYEKIGGMESYMNNGYYTYFSNEGNMYYYMDSLGEIHEEEISRHFGIKPMISIQNAKVLKGEGTLENPFQIEPSKNLLKDALIGNYVNYSGYTWRIIENKETIKLALQQNIEMKTINGEIFSKTSEIRKYLNTTFYDTLENKDYLIESTWNIGTYDGVIEDIYTVQDKAYIGLHEIDDFYIHDVEDSLFINTSVLNEFVYTPKEGILYKKEINKEYGIKPVISLKNTLKIVGDGTKDTPYEIVGEES